MVTATASWAPRSGDLQELVDALAERLKRSVAVDDRAIRLLVASRHFGDEDPVRVQSVLGREVDPAITDKTGPRTLAGARTNSANA